MMTAFYNVMKKQINKKNRTKLEYQETIASWLYAGFLTEDEATDLLEYLDTVYPEEEVTE